MTLNNSYSWEFQRLGGINQVIIRNAEDLEQLENLNPKLWVALSCPAAGLEFDSKTLSFLDKDKDGRIRIPEIIETIRWLKKRLTTLDSIIKEESSLRLDIINQETEEGQRILQASRSILKNIKNEDKQEVTLEDLAASNALNADRLYNGDGIVPATDKVPENVRTFIEDTLNVMGGVVDASGLNGINTEIATAFVDYLKAWKAWDEKIGSATTEFGENTAEMWNLIQAVKSKVDDYFLRVELASYAPQAENSLNIDEKYIVPNDNGILENDALAELPLAKIKAGEPLHLNEGINPIWKAQIQRLGELMLPFLAEPGYLTQTEWTKVQSLLAPYEKTIQSKPLPVNTDITVQPTLAIEKLSKARLDELLEPDLLNAFNKIALKDKMTPTSTQDLIDIEKIILFNQNFYQLLQNFVSFHDFFSLNNKAAFQAGQLYIDGRCCSLCISVTDVAKHQTLAGYSELFLIYCDCTRKQPTTDGIIEQKHIVAAMTAGDADFLLEGRNAVFVDNLGQDWDAKVIKIISKPIGLSQAIWDPYKRMGRFITEQIDKWATAKDSDIMSSADKLVKAEQAPNFDIAKSVGIFAAIGLALGALGTAIASIASALFQLQWWQFPLVFLGLFILISGPSVLLAWLKLRNRTLGPLLEASGWAINSKIKINLFLGTRLTTKAYLPKHAKRNFIDPTKHRYYGYIVFLFVLILAISGGFYLWNKQSGEVDVTAQATDQPEVVVTVDETPPPVEK